MVLYEGEDPGKVSLHADKVIPFANVLRKIWNSSIALYCGKYLFYCAKILYCTVIHGVSHFWAAQQGVTTACYAWNSLNWKTSLDQYSRESNPVAGGGPEGGLLTTELGSECWRRREAESPDSYARGSSARAGGGGLPLPLSTSCSYYLPVC